MSPSAPSSSWWSTARLADRPPLLATLYLLGAVLLAVIGWSGLWSDFSLLPTRVSPWYTLVTAVPASAIVLLKRRAPLVGLLLSVALFIADLMTVGGLVPLLVMLEMLHSYVLILGPEQRRRVLLPLIAFALLPFLAALIIAGELQTAILIALPFGALLGLTYWYANSVAQSRELVELHQRRAEDAERLAEVQRVAAVQGERDRMARELHDVVAGHIAAVAIRSEGALARPGLETPEREALRAVRESSLEAHQALRSMIRVLRSGGRQFSLSPGRDQVPELVREATVSGVSVAFDDRIDERLPTPVDQALGRIVQEALANAVRHSSGAEVIVSLSEHREEVRIEVISREGIAFSEPRLEGSGLGLGMLAERARALGGELTAGPDFDETGRRIWAVRATLPKEQRA